MADNPKTTALALVHVLEARLNTDTLDYQDWQAINRQVIALHKITRAAVQAFVRTSEPELEVIVGNVGCVYRGSSLEDAYETYHGYVARSQAGDGRAAGEPVTILRGDHELEHYAGTLADETDD